MNSSESLTFPTTMKIMLGVESTETRWIGEIWLREHIYTLIYMYLEYIYRQIVLIRQSLQENSYFVCVHAEISRFLRLSCPDQTFFWLSEQTSLIA